MNKDEANRKLSLAWKIAKGEGVYMSPRKRFVEIRRMKKECEECGMWWHATRLEGVIRYLNKVG